MQEKQINHDERNLAGLTPLEQVAMNTAGCQILRELFGKTRSSLDTDWLALSQAKKAAICAIARQPRGELMTATLSAPASNSVRASSTDRTPPPTVSGMKQTSAVRRTTSTIVSRPSWLAPISRKHSSSAPAAS